MPPAQQQIGAQQRIHPGLTIPRQQLPTPVHLDMGVGVPGQIVTSFGSQIPSSAAVSSMSQVHSQQSHFTQQQLQQQHAQRQQPAHNWMQPQSSMPQTYQIPQHTMPLSGAPGQPESGAFERMLQTFTQHAVQTQSQPMPSQNAAHVAQLQHQRQSQLRHQLSMSHSIDNDLRIRLPSMVPQQTISPGSGGRVQQPIVSPRFTSGMSLPVQRPTSHTVTMRIKTEPASPPSSARRKDWGLVDLTEDDTQDSAIGLMDTINEEVSPIVIQPIDSDHAGIIEIAPVADYEPPPPSTESIPQPQVSAVPQQQSTASATYLEQPESPLPPLIPANLVHQSPPLAGPDQPLHQSPVTQSGPVQQSQQVSQSQQPVAVHPPQVSQSLPVRTVNQLEVQSRSELSTPPLVSTTSPATNQPVIEIDDTPDVIDWIDLENYPPASQVVDVGSDDEGEISSGEVGQVCIYIYI